MSYDLNESWNYQCGDDKFCAVGKVTYNEGPKYNVCFLSSFLLEVPLTCQLCVILLNMVFTDFFPLPCHLLLLLTFSWDPSRVTSPQCLREVVQVFGFSPHAAFHQSESHGVANDSDLSGA